MRSATLLLLVSGVAARLAPTKVNSLVPSNVAAVPSWACAMPDADSSLAAREVVLGGLHRLYATGNATKDKANAASVEEAAKKLEKEEESDAKDFASQANASAVLAKKEAQKAADLDAKANAEVEADPKAAEKDSKEAVDAAKAAVNASEGAKLLSGDALAVEKVAGIEASKMFAVANKLEEDVAAEKLQAVQAVDGPTLTGLIAKKDLLVVFYAPWCGHCQTYVLADESGNAEKAPVELLNKELQKSGGPEVVKYDVDEGGIPSDMQVKHIPTIFFAGKDGVRAKYEGDPHDFAAIKAFVTKGHKAEAKTDHMITVLTKLDAAAKSARLRKREMKA